MMRYLLAPLFLAALATARSANPLVRCNDVDCVCVGRDGRDLGYRTSVDADVEKTCECAVADYEYSLTGLIGMSFSCDEHGNYGPVQCVGSVCHCSTASGDKIGYETSISRITEKNCQCARDQHAYQQTGMVGKIFSCDELGNYNAVQCLGSVCHCASASGEKIGYESPISQYSEKNCKCALDKHEFQKTGMVGKTFSCNELGNYNAVQCVGSVCHCASASGEKIGYESPISQYSEKNCKCALDKHEYQQTGMVGKTFSCDQHGNYKPVNCLGSVCHCTTSNGQNIGYETPIHLASEKTCKCALDKHEFQQSGMVGQTFSCDQHGNYKPVRCVGSVCHCASPDGQHLGYETSMAENHVKTCQCALDKYAYEQKGLLGHSFSCDKHGNYNPVRCVGSVCFCVDLYGKQVSESTVSIGQQHELNC